MAEKKWCGSRVLHNTNPRRISWKGEQGCLLFDPGIICFPQEGIVVPPPQKEGRKKTKTKLKSISLSALTRVSFPPNFNSQHKDRFDGIYYVTSRQTLHTRFRAIGSGLYELSHVPLAIANHKDCHFSSQRRGWEDALLYKRSKWRFLFISLLSLAGLLDCVNYWT